LAVLDKVVVVVVAVDRRGKEGGSTIVVKSGDSWLMSWVDDMAVCFVMHGHTNGT
jgi:hypothetical protein